MRAFPSILVGAGVTSGLFLVLVRFENVLRPVLSWPEDFAEHCGIPHLWAESISVAVIVMPLALVGGVVTLLLYRRSHQATVCRACGHTLRGLSRPECPECGLHI